MARSHSTHTFSLPRVAGLLVLAALLSGCASGPQLRSASAPGVDLGTFKTFSFFPELSTDRAGFHTLISQQLVFSTRREMEVRGFVFVPDPTQADLLINFYTDVAEQFRVRSTMQHWHGPSYWHHRRGFYDPWWGHRHWPVHSSVEVEQFSEGTLSVDVVDRARNTLVWEGAATKRLTQRTLNELGPALDDAVHRMFGRFPVPPRL
jgi:hypothetical protein